jgi:hypothetical protein
MADLNAMQGLNLQGLPTMNQLNVNGVRPPPTAPAVVTSPLNVLANQLMAQGISLPGAGNAPVAPAGPAPVATGPLNTTGVPYSTANLDMSQVSPTQLQQLKMVDPTTFGAPVPQMPQLITSPTRASGGGAVSASGPAPATQPSSPGDASLSARNGFPNNVELIRGGQVAPDTSAWGATPGGVPGGFVDPRAAIAAGYQQQEAYRRQGLSDVMAAARQGDPGNYSFRLSRLVDAIGQNNFGAVQGQGTNSLNAAMAGVTSAGLGANASMYGSDQATARTAAEIAQQNTNLAATPVQAGAVGIVPEGGVLPITVPTYAKRVPNANGGFDFQSMGAQAQREEAKKPVVGKTYVDKAGNRAVYQSDGSYKAE